MSVPYREVDFRTGNRLQLKDMLIAGLGEIGFESFMDNAGGFLAYIPEPDYDGNAVETLLRSLAAQVEHSSRIIAPQNWNAVWEEQFEPVRINEHCLIRAPFHSPVNDGSLELIIEPKMSFGTGHHSTTRLMAQALFDMNLNGKAVLDMGCGTGVLGILAAKLGATSVTGIDTEEWAVENTRENAARNEVGMEALHGDAALLGGRCFDVILANINRNILLRDLPAYRQVLSPGGILALSGFLVTDAETMYVAGKANRLSVLKELREESWCCISLLNN